MRRYLLVALLLACSCAGTFFRWESVRQLQPGMTEDQVIAIMGRPYSVTTAGDRDILTWSWAEGITGSNRAVALTFEKGQLVSVPRIPASY